MLICSGVPIRDFVDAAGVLWQVWSTVPYTTGVARSFREGWLTFECTHERRRLAPIPNGWEEASAAQLRVYCGRAEAIGRTPITGTWRISPEETDR